MTIKNNQGSDNIPPLRFPEFEGEWEMKKVGELCDFIVPGRNKPTNFNGEIPWITTPDIEHNGVVYFSKKELSISKEEAKKVGSKIVPKNSIIISCVGELGLVAIAGVEMVINQQLHAFLPQNVEYRFLLYSLGNQKKYMETVATKTAVPYMNKDNCNSIPISCPTLPEQTKIATFLKAVDEKIQALKKKNSLLEQYKKGVMQKLFSQELRFKDENGNDFPEWEVKKLGEVCEIIMGQSPSSNSYNSDETGVPLIQGNADIQNRVSNPRNWTTEKTKECFIGDLILTVRAPVGAVAKSIHNACIGRGVCAIRNNSKSINEFIYQFLLDYENKWSSLEQGSTFAAVSSNDVKKIEIKLPSLKQQTAIANFLSALDEKISQTQQQIEKTKVWKKGLLQKMFVYGQTLVVAHNNKTK